MPYQWIVDVRKRTPGLSILAVRGQNFRSTSEGGVYITVTGNAHHWLIHALINTAQGLIVKSNKKMPGVGKRRLVAEAVNFNEDFRVKSLYWWMILLSDFYT